MHVVPFRFGFMATLARMPREDYRLEAAEPTTVTPRPAPPQSPPPQSPVSSLERAPSLDSDYSDSGDAADDVPQSPEERAMDLLDVVFTTEEVVWGAGTNQVSSGLDVANKDAAKYEERSFSVHMKAHTLLDAQRSATEAGGFTMTESMLITPIIDKKGHSIFTLSTLHKNLFSKLDRSEDISLDKLLPMSNDSHASYWLNTTAAAMRVATDNIAAKRAAALAAGDSLRGTKHSKRDLLELQITAAAEQKNQIIDDFVKRSHEVRTHMTEIRAYKKPPGKTCQIVVALLILLGEEGMEDYLGPELTDFPDEMADPKKYHTLWYFARSHIQVSKRHPAYILRRMVNMSKGMVIGEDDDGDMAKQMMAVKELLSTVSMEAAARSTQTLLHLLEWWGGATCAFIRRRNNTSSLSVLPSGDPVMLQGFNRPGGIKSLFEPLRVSNVEYANEQ